MKQISIFLFIVNCFTFSDIIWAACIKKKSAHLHSGPGNKYKVLWEVKKYMPLLIIKKYKSWVQVKDLDGDVSWVRKGDLSLKKNCGIIKSKKATLRKASGNTMSLQKNFARKYETFKIIKENGKEILVSDIKGKKYWAYKKDLWINSD